MRFDRFFGKKSTGPSPDPIGEDDEIPVPNPQPIHGPPEFVRAAEMQQAYWTQDAEALAQLEARGVEQLGWRELLRLHHLICLLPLNRGTEREVANEKCRQTVRRLLAGDSPYRPRPAAIWQGQSAQGEGDREPDMQGDLLNPSLTHFGCLEVYRLDAVNEPTQIDFVGFDELSGVLFAPTKLIRVAKLFYEDGRNEMVFVPLLYGLTWAIGNDYDRAGQMTRFVSHLDGAERSPTWASGIGVGQQDLSVCRQDGGAHMFGLGSVAEVVFPLDAQDPRFDEKARARGMDPDDLRRQMGSDRG
jgi:hypothetical protein